MTRFAGDFRKGKIALYVALFFVAPAVGAALVFSSAETANAAFASPFTNCFRDSDCSGIPGGAWCRNRVCHSGPPQTVCADRCVNLPYCNPGSASCGGHSVSVNGSTVHVTDCRCIAGVPGGCISYCSQSAPPPPTPTPRPPTPTPTPTPSIPAGTIEARCVGWPNPRIEIRWSSNPPPGQGAKNSNSILKYIDGGSGFWFYGGGNPPPGVAGTRINGAYASPVGPGGYPEPNYAVYDLRDTAVQAGHTYGYKAKYRPDLASSNTATVTVNSANCGGPAPTPTPPTPTPSSPPAGAGRITGVCVWRNGAPEVRLNWSQSPPPGTGAATVNALQKGDSYPSDPGQYWDFLPLGQSQYAYTDTAVQLDTQYQYRAKYQPNVTSVNTYNIFVSTTNCGGPAPTPGPLVLRPSFQNVPPSVTAQFSAEGGTGTYSWTIEGGTQIGSGPNVAATFTNADVNPVTRTVTVRSGAQAVAATVQVDGVQTYQDDINLGDRGDRYVLINGDARYTDSRSVDLTLFHGFSVASSSVTMRVSNTLAGVAVAPVQPFRRDISSWDLCAGLSSCNEGLYAVYVDFIPPSGVPAATVLDTVTYLYTIPGEGGTVLIDSGATTTTSRLVDLTLVHTFAGVPDDEVTIQIANSLDELAGAPMLPFTGTYPDWDLCAGTGAACPNGPRTVYVKFCARGTCSSVAQDSIELDSPWPDWGVRINFGEPNTAANDVQLLLNPWFNETGTDVRIAALPDLSDALTFPWSDTVPWDLCYGHGADCPFGDYTVYVQYVNNEQTGWPSPDSPWYEDAIAYVSGTPTPTPSPAAILIEGGAPATESRFVQVSFDSPFGTGAEVQMRPVDERGLSPRDKELIEKTYAGGIPSQPEPTPRQTPLKTPEAPVTRDSAPKTPLPVLTPAEEGLRTQAGEPAPTPGTNPAAGQTLPAIDDQILPPEYAPELPELESGTARAFVPAIGSWDICQGAQECPYGTYKIFVQFYRKFAGTQEAAAGGATLGALGDQISQVYYDTIVYASPTPTPSGSPPVSPSIPPPTGSVPPPTGTPPVGTPTPTGGPLPPWVPGAGGINGIVGALSGAQPVVGPLALASAVAVAVSAVAALAPLLGSAGAASFIWQWFMGALGLLPKRKKTWGTVYDANTKRPIPFAKVQLLDRNRRVLETRIADKDGRYGFLTTPESLLAEHVQISIAPSAKDYSFPSHTQATVDMFVYNNIYRGDLITVDEKTLINFDIPMDPLRPSGAPLVLKSPSIALGAATAAMADAGFWLGLIMVPLSFLVNPNPFTFGTLCLFLGTASLRLFGIAEHPFGTVTDSQTGRAMPFALMTLNDLTGKRVAFAVSDEQGRYFIVAERGTYELVVYTPATIQPPRQSRQTVEVKKGWITRGIKI